MTPVTVERGAPRRDFERIVLVTLDTLRADHVSCYGYPRRTTPFLDSLAERGVRFTRALAAVSHTAPSHATMLTGVVPAVHGVLANGGTLAPELPDLAELCAQSGLETAAFLNVKFLAGVAASFQRVGVRAVGADGRILNGSDVVEAALRWLKEKRASERFLLWVHLYDPHRWKELVLERAASAGPIWSAATPGDFRARLCALHGLPPLAGDDDRVAWRVEDEKRSVADLDLGSAAGFLRCIDAYDELTRFADSQVERLQRGLEALALPGRTLWVITSDHGEGLASHGVAGHGGRIYQEQLRVPLILWASDGSLGPRVVDELVGHVDLFPTLAETLGARLAGAEPLFEGRSLWPLVRGEGWSPRAVFAQRRPSEGGDDPDPGAVYALQDARHKLILHEPGADEFYDLATDPLEARDLGGEHADAAVLRAALEERLRRFAGLGAHASESVPAEWEQELRDLGYAR